MRLLAHTADFPRDRHEDAYDLGPISDGDLLDAWNRDRQPQALATLIRRYNQMVLSVCPRRCRSAVDADDAFQTTFLYLARNGHKIRKPERLAGWLHRVAQRAAVATWKTAKRESEPMVEPPDDPDDPLDRLTQRHEAIVLDEELADLPEHYRSALVMHVYEELPLQKLAEHFGTTIGTIRGRLQRGKKLLARRLRHRGVVPVMAFAAANTWSAPAAEAAQVGDALVEATSGGLVPGPPIQPSLFEPLLSQGVRLMPSLYTVAGVLGGSAVVAMMMTGDGTSNGQSPGARETITLQSPHSGQHDSQVTVASADSNAPESQAAQQNQKRRQPRQDQATVTPSATAPINAQLGQGGGGMGGQGGGFGGGQFGGGGGGQFGGGGGQ